MKCVAQPYEMKVLRKVGGSHVEEGDFCEIPIGRDDTGGAGVWDLYRDGLYRGKMDENWSEKCVKTLVKLQIFHEWTFPQTDLDETRSK